MQIYFDGKCGFCKKCVEFVQKNLSVEVGDVNFSNIWESKYATFAHDTMVVVDEKGKEYFYGAGLVQTNKIMKYPYKFGYFIPIIIMDFIYWLMKVYRKI